MQIYKAIYLLHVKVITVTVCVRTLRVCLHVYEWINSYVHAILFLYVYNYI